VPTRNICASVAFTKADPMLTANARENARAQACYVYMRDSNSLSQLKAKLRNTLVELTTAKALKDVDPEIWKTFLPIDDGKSKPLTAKQQEERFQAFQAALTTKERMDRVERAIGEVLAPFEEKGILQKVDRETLGQGNEKEILVFPAGKPESRRIVRVSDVLIGKGDAIYDGLRKNPDVSSIADGLFAWLMPRLKPTLTVNDLLTKDVREEAGRSVPEVLVNYSAGQVLVQAHQMIDPAILDLLHCEYAEAMSLRPWAQRLNRAIAITSLVFVALLVCGVYMRYHEGVPLLSLTRLILLLLLAIATVGLARLFGLSNDWRAEILPLLLFSMTMAIVHQQRLATLMATMLTVITVFAVGHGFSEYLMLSGATCAAVLSLERIRTRSKLVSVGFFAGIVAVLLSIGMLIINDQPFSRALVNNALLNGAWALAAGFIMTGALPFIENLFGVLTDLSLLELGDVAHPLLQELVRRAPSTYNHSITVGSIAEAAAESIQARGLLVRVGSYFHDIGKMLKPTYFIENQGPDDNRHEALVPAMSTLVIIAHIKDGADLARQHRLPQPIIDLVAQHHGTTRVEFFFGRATEQQMADPNASEVDESSFRYPGPKPQTKEAAVLMLADAVESASRTLVDPAPARIESMVREIAEARLRDGQFDESGLTLRELRTIEKSMVMSLTSIYHGRIKYPEQRTA
jgi:putative nucleotidyltransferase with HDIG domain